MIENYSKSQFLWLSERSERNHSILWGKSPPSHYLIKRYYIDTRVQKVAKSVALYFVDTRVQKVAKSAALYFVDTRVQKVAKSMALYFIGTMVQK